MQSPDEMFLFHPVKYPEGDWSPANLDYEDVWFRSSDGTQLHAWYCPVREPRAIVLYCHGNAGHLAGRTPQLAYLQRELGVSVLIVDYRGYGRSEGTPTIKGVVADARAARARLAELGEIDESGIVILGRSLGGAIAVQLAAQKSPRGLILESTFPSFREVAKEHFPALAWLIPGHKLNSVRAISEINCPLLQSHGDADEVVSIEGGRRLFEAASEPRQFMTLEGLGHNDAPTSDYYRVVERFLDGLPRR